MANKILLTGGGSGGPTAPLIALYEELQEKSFDYASTLRHGLRRTRQDDKFEFRWIGTRHGPEQEMIREYEISFFAFPAAKLRRYVSFRTLLEPFIFVAALIRSFIFLLSWRPCVIVSAGAYVSVPVVITGWVLRIPVLIHQQDIQVTLSNKLMAPFASVITASFEGQKKDFPGRMVVVTGNPVRKEILRQAQDDNSEINNSNLGLESGVPVLLVLGGGQGSQQINSLVLDNLDALIKFCQVVHVTGKEQKNRETEKQRNRKTEKQKSDSRYFPFEFLTDKLADVLHAADVVVTRAGMSFLSELSVLGKPTIIVPIPHSHQVKNAEYWKQKNAAKVLRVDFDLTSKDHEEFVSMVKELITNPGEQKKLSEHMLQIMPRDGAERVAQQLIKLL